MPVTWAGLYEAGLAAQPVIRAAAPRQGRPKQLPVLGGNAQATTAAAAAPARPRRQPTVHCRGTGAPGSEGAHPGARASGVRPPLARHAPQPSSSEPSSQSGRRSQRRSVGRHSPLPQASCLGEQRALEPGSPGRAVVGTVKGAAPVAGEREEGRA